MAIPHGGSRKINRGGRGYVLAHALERIDRRWHVRRLGAFVIKERVIAGRGPQLEKLRLDIGTATTQALQSGCGVADVVLALLTRADQLCEIAEASGADLGAVAGAFEPERSRAKGKRERIRKSDA